MSEQITPARIPEQVEYRPIEGYPGYRVGDDGSVWTCLKRGAGHRSRPSDQWRPLAQYPHKRTGHRRVKLSRFAERTAERFFVHHLVLRAFVGPRPAGLECCHEDGNPANNRLSNLRWGTRQSNRADRTRHGCGRSRSKATPETVQQMRRLSRDGASDSSLARTFDLSRATVYDIVRRHTWKDVPDAETDDRAGWPARKP